VRGLAGVSKSHSTQPSVLVLAMKPDGLRSSPTYSAVAARQG